MKTWVAVVVGFALAIAVSTVRAPATETHRAPVAMVTTGASLQGCTKQQAENVVNGAFTAEQVACMILNAGVFGDPAAVQLLEVGCQLSPALEKDIQAFIDNMKAHPDALAKLQATGLKYQATVVTVSPPASSK